MLLQLKAVKNKLKQKYYEIPFQVHFRTTKWDFFIGYNHKMADDQIENLKLPPHSVEAEQSLLGGLLIDNEGLDKVSDVINHCCGLRKNSQDTIRAMAAALSSVSSGII